MSLWTAAAAACLVPTAAAWVATRPASTTVDDFDVVRRAAPSARRTGPRVLFVGGNPGVAAYYAQFAADLAAAVDGDVCVLGLRGFGPRGARWWRDAVAWCGGRARGCFDVDAQIANAEVFAKAEAHAAAAEDRPFVLVGHSIGAYFGLKAVERVGSPHAAAVVVAPYLENNWASAAFSREARALTGPLGAPLVVAYALLAALVGVAPRALRFPVLRWTGQTAGMDAFHAALTVDAMCAFGPVFTMAALGRSEMRRLAAPFGGPWPDAVVLSTRADKWGVSPALADRAPGYVLRVDDAPHAFSTATASRDAVVAAVARALRGATLD